MQREKYTECIITVVKNKTMVTEKLMLDAKDKMKWRTMVTDVCFK